MFQMEARGIQELRYAKRVARGLQWGHQATATVHRGMAATIPEPVRTAVIQRLESVIVGHRIAIPTRTALPIQGKGHVMTVERQALLLVTILRPLAIPHIAIRNTQWKRIALLVTP